MNEKGTNFCSFPVGLEPATPAYEAVTKSIPPPWLVATFVPLSTLTVREGRVFGATVLTSRDSDSAF